MGNPSPSVYSGRPRAASTVLSAITAFLPFLAPPTASLASVLDKLINGAQEIMSITQKSKRRELVDFGDHVGKMISQLVTALQNDQLDCNTILDQMPRTQSGGLLSFIRRLLFPEEIDIGQMRQRLDDGLQVFQLGAFVELLSRGASPLASGTANTSEPHQTQTQTQTQPPGASHSSNFLAYNYPRSRERQTTRTPSSFPLDWTWTWTGPPDALRLDTQRATSQRTPTTVASISNPEPGEITAAFLNVDIRRRSFQHQRSPIKAMELATAYDRLSDLLAGTGRTREALEASQKSAELYRTLAQMEH
ncbi:hypothetical protein B0J17DRAFT_683611 [Rhizoctonia solani]|nr:hypothetical protein B0J17DRAFT_683611 [Rhizoctonia solani]